VQIPELIESVLPTNRKKLVELSLKRWLGQNSLTDTAADHRVLDKYGHRRALRHSRYGS